MTNKQIIVVVLLLAFGGILLITYILPKFQLNQTPNQPVSTQPLSEPDLKKEVPQGLPSQYVMASSSPETEIINGQMIEDPDGTKHRYLVFEVNQDITSAKKYYAEIYKQEG